MSAGGTMRTAVLILCSFLATSVAAQEFVTECVRPSGHKYYLAGIAVEEQNVGWRPDWITGGRVDLYIGARGEPSLRFKDATETVKNIPAANAAWLPSGDPMLRMVGVFGPQSSSIYMFSLDNDNNGTLLLLIARGGMVVSSGSILAYTCSGDKAQK